MRTKHLLVGLAVTMAVVVGGGLFGVMGYSMWVMKDMMQNMSANMNDMKTFMGNMGSVEGGYMKTMSRDMADMRSYMLLMAGDAEQIKVYRNQGGENAAVYPESIPEETASGHATCQDFLKTAGIDQVGFAGVRVDEASIEERRHESYMAAMKRDLNELDTHVFCMYLAMSADMAAMREAMRIMAPSVASMGPTMGYMGQDMNRGVSSFTSPMHYMFNAFR
jgi:hypothetical protein